MVSVMVDLVVSKLGVMMTEQIHERVSPVLNFRREFEWLTKNLTKIESYLREADLHSAQDGYVKSWLLNVLETALDAEDILDECAIESQGTDNGNIQSYCVCAFTCSKLAFFYKMGRRIKEVKERMMLVMEDAGKLKLVGDVIHSDQGSMGTVQNVKCGRTSLMESDSGPVAIEPNFEDVLRLLDDHVVSVMVVTGMGGMGKIFLLQHVFDRTKDKFEKSIWLSVSQTYSLQKLQAALALKINLNDVVNGRVYEVQTAELIHDRLKSTGTFIVLDDVWRATREDNLISAVGLPAGNLEDCPCLLKQWQRPWWVRDLQGSENPNWGS